jgi:hypothetical protein
MAMAESRTLLQSGKHYIERSKIRYICRGECSRCISHVISIAVAAVNGYED